MSDFDRFTDVLGQLPFLKSYTHLLQLFPVADAAAEKHAVDALDRAASKLTLAFPWLAGRVVNDGRTDTNSGVFRIVPGEPPTSIIRIKHFHRDEHPSFDDIVATKGPFEKLDGALLAPTCAFPETYDEPEAPVVVFQANFVSGGLLLDFAAQHNTMDITGMTQCLRLFAAAMRGEDVPLAALGQGNRDRRCLIPLFEAGRPLLDHTHLQRPVQTGGKGLRSVSYNWKTLRFGPDKLATLKRQATEDISRARELDPDADGTDVDFVSTNDALCAFMWQMISAARLRAGVPPATLSKFSRAIDGRRALGISQEYMGHMIHTNMTRLALGSVAGRPLGLVAADLRRSLVAGTSADVVRSFATLIARTEDRSGISFGATFDPDLDVACSSWMHSDVYGQVFGALGCPELVRRPRFLPLRVQAPVNTRLSLLHPAGGVAQVPRYGSPIPWTASAWCLAMASRAYCAISAVQLSLGTAPQASSRHGDRSWTLGRGSCPARRLNSLSRSMQVPMASDAPVGTDKQNLGGPGEVIEAREVVWAACLLDNVVDKGCVLHVEERLGQPAA